MIDAKLLVEKAFEAQKFAYTPSLILMLEQHYLVQMVDLIKVAT